MQLTDSAFYYRTFDLSRSLDFLLIAQKIVDSGPHEKLRADGNNRIGLIYSLMGQYERSYVYLDLAREYYEKAGDDKSFAKVASNLATLHYNLREYDKAIKYNLAALEIHERTGNDGGRAVILTNLANSYQRDKETRDLAIEYYKEAYDLFLSANNFVHAGVARMNIAEVTRDQGKLDETISELLVAEAVFDSTDTQVYLPNLYNIMAEVYLELGQSDLALEYIEESLNLSQVQKLLREELEASYIYSRILKERGEHEKALDYLDRHLALKDSVYDIDKLSAIAQIEYNALIHKKDQEIELQTERSQLQRRINVYITAALIFAIALLLTLFMTSRRFARTNVILAKQKRELQEKSEHLEAVNHDKNRLFGVISHDLRGPIANLGGLLELIAQEDLSQEEFQSLSGKLNTHFGHLSASLDNLLVWSSNQMRGVTPKPALFDVSDACDEVLDLLKPVARDKHITVQNLIPDRTMAHGDAEQIKIALRNLVGNALKFTPQDGVVTISSTKGFGSSLQISVADTGIGMPRELQERLFKAGEDFTTFGTKGERGTGLGLNLCRDFIQANNGKFWFDSKPGHGSTFYFTLATEKENEQVESKKATA